MANSISHRFASQVNILPIASHDLNTIFSAKILNTCNLINAALTSYSSIRIKYQGEAEKEWG
ncbi:MAG: hypothetical protein IH598_09210 [Bacteroidales bacterium]|nr:hypothetical protein [Bacteroidales bacterium]